MPRKKREAASPSQTELLDITAKLRTGPCVPALREAVKAWKAGGYKTVTDTTRILLNHWFHMDHRSPTGLPFKYHASQQEAIETLIFVWETEKAHAEGTLFLTNIQQFYDRPDRSNEDEPDAMTAVLGSKPPTKKLELTDFGDHIALRSGKLLVVNDEAHHTHDEESEWNKV